MLSLAIWLLAQPATPPPVITSAVYWVVGANGCTAKPAPLLAPTDGSCTLATAASTGRPIAAVDISCGTTTTRYFASQVACSASLSGKDPDEGARGELDALLGCMEDIPALEVTLDVLAAVDQRVALCNCTAPEIGKLARGGRPSAKAFAAATVACMRSVGIQPTADEVQQIEAGAAAQLNGLTPFEVGRLGARYGIPVAACVVAAVVILRKKRSREKASTAPNAPNP